MDALTNVRRLVYAYGLKAIRIVLPTIGLYAAIRLVDHIYPRFWRRIGQWILDACMLQYNVEHVRPQMRNTPVPAPRVHTDTHSHPVEAAKRAAADNHIEKLIELSGRAIWSFATSPKDEHKGIQGAHDLYQMKDLTRPAFNDPKPSDTSVKLIDVDYYLTSRDFFDLMRPGYPVYIYTVTPKHLSNETDEYVYSWKHEQGIDKLRMTISGGTTYEHQLWSWYDDCSVVYGPFGQALVFNIDRIDLDNEHSIVLLTPRRLVPYYALPLLYFMVDVYSLRRLTVTVEPTAQIQCMPDHETPRNVLLQQADSFEVSIHRGVLHELIQYTSDPNLSGPYQLLNGASAATTKL
jgi:hypothetical protein